MPATKTNGKSTANNKAPRQSAESSSVKLIEVPLGELGGYETDQVAARLNTTRQRDGMKRLQRGLKDSGASLENGKKVASAGDAVKWLMEQL